MTTLSAEKIEEKLNALPHWRFERGEIVRDAEFKDFQQAMDFINAVARQAEAANHHPDIDIRYNKVRLALISHDAGGLTQRDFHLATSIESLLNA